MFRKLSFHGQSGEVFSNKALFALIIPLLAEQFLAVMVGMADTVMVSGVGESAVAAISMVDIMNIFFVQLFTAMSAGGAVVAAQYLGHREEQNACLAAKQLVFFTLIISTTIGILISIFNRPIISLMDDNSDPVLFQQACTYLMITALSYPFLGLYNAGVGLMRAMGNSKTSMWVSVAMNLINISGNLLLIHPCGLGVAGAAISTLFSRMVSALIILALLFKPNMPIHLPSPHSPGFFKLDFTMIRRIFRLGVPNGLENSLFQLGRLLIMGIIATFPTAIRAANGIANSVAGMMNIPCIAVNLAVVTVIGQLIGAGKKDEALRYGKKLLRIMYMVDIPLNLALVIAAEPVVRLFNLSEAGIPVAVEILMLYGALSILTYPSSFGMPNILRAAGDARFTMTVSIISMLVLRLGASYLLVFGLGFSLLGVWISMHLDWIARSILFGIRFASKKWLDKKVI